jgi:molybdate transport system substrate-binding protein
VKLLRRDLRYLLLTACFVFGMRLDAFVAAQPAVEPLTVFAAASLTDVLQEIGQAYASGGAQAPRMSFAASSVLARQIEAGARADVFFSADQEWMDYLAARGLIRGDSRVDIVANRLVLIAPAASAMALRITRGFPLVAALGDGRLATGDPDFVPAGRYARSALMSLGVWNEVADRLVRAENVRVALAYVARGEAPLGIVYATDARAEPRVRVVDVFPADSHLPIHYPVAATTSAGAAALAFIGFARGTTATEIFQRAGFVPLAAEAR